MTTLYYGLIFYYIYFLQLNNLFISLRMRILYLHLFAYNFQIAFHIFTKQSQKKLPEQYNTTSLFKY